MFEGLFNLTPTAQEALRNPAEALRRGMKLLPQMIAEKERMLQQLTNQLQQLGGGFFDQMLRNTTEQGIQETQTQITYFQDTLNFISSPMYAPQAVWAFDPVEQHITNLYQNLAGHYASLQSTTEPYLEWENNFQNSQEAGGLADLFMLTLGKQAVNESADVILLIVCKLTVELRGLYKIRRSLIPACVKDIATWNRQKLEVELQKRRRDLDELPTELKQPAPALSNLSALVATLLEQRKFLEDIIIELEAALRHLGTQQLPPPNPAAAAAAKIARIADLQREMEDQIKKYPAMEADIRRMFGKLIDDERRKP